MKAATILLGRLVELLLISIHAAREGGDMRWIPLRSYRAISIHAAREGGDVRFVVADIGQIYFNPRRP